METVPRLFQEVTQTFLLIAIAGLTLFGYLGIALLVVGAVR